MLNKPRIRVQKQQQKNPNVHQAESGWYLCPSESQMPLPESPCDFMGAEPCCLAGPLTKLSSMETWSQDQ